MKRSLVAASLLCLLALPARAGWEEAVAAYNNGDYATAAREFRPFAEQGQVTAQYILGWIYQTGEGVSQDLAEAAKWYRRAADKGNADAQLALGSLYAAGAGVKRDDAEAAKLFRKAAEQGKANAQYMLGYMLSAGEGVARNEAESLVWYRKAAEQGLPDAQYALGLGLAFGKGATRDEQEANGWYRKAAEQGHVESAYLLGWNYERGVGTIPSYEEAAKWYRKAADKGNVEAQFQLATLYRDGRGVARDDAQAMALFRKAAEKDYAYTTAAVDEFLRNGRPQAGFELADVWLARHPEDVQLLLVVSFAAITEARADPAKYGALARRYGDATLALIENGKRPAAMPDTEWSEYRDRWQPQLQIQLGTLASKAGSSDEARTRFQKATTLNPKEAYGWYLLGQTYFAEYEKLNAASKALEGSAKSEAVAKAFAKLDQVIESYARTVALAEGKDNLKDLYAPVLKDLTNVYEFRNGSRSGLEQLIARYRS
jgi:TPR repeat protein